MTDEAKAKGDVKERVSEDVKAIITIVSVLEPLDAQARIHVLEFVLKRLGISLTTAPSRMGPIPVISEMNSAVSAARTASSDITDIRGFAAETNPKTVNEKVTVVA